MKLVVETGDAMNPKDGAAAHLPADAVSRMAAYIDAHLGEPLTLHEIASAAGYSRFHAARLFRAGWDRPRSSTCGTDGCGLRPPTRRGCEQRPRVIDIAFDFAFVYLASPLSASYVSGAMLRVTGGKPVF